ncbi:MAG: efflux RND transporter periplasmic adaptor subunit [bacterium]|nr:efflux RND transporter periplasmic adaptor subunit [bacterium]
MNKIIIFSTCILLFACKPKVEKIKPTFSPISESVYASGVLKSKNQYQAFATVGGIIDELLVEEGDTVKKGDAILTIANEAQRLNKENAELSANFAEIGANQGKINEAKQMVILARIKMQNDSSLFSRQSTLWQQQIGSKVELEQRELAYQNSKTAYLSSIVHYNDLKRQLVLNSAQSKKNFQIISKMASDFTLRSEINGKIYQLPKSKGELVGAQTILAVIGDAQKFYLEMQVDEMDILKIKKGLKVMVVMDSYKGRVFEALVTKIDPIMNERSKTFTVEAEFIELPKLLYPNITLEANIVIQTKKNVMLLPRNYLLNDSFVIKANGDKVAVKTGLRDYQKIEILSGINADDELIKPIQ